MIPKPNYSLVVPQDISHLKDLVLPKDWSFLHSWFNSIPAILTLSPEAYEVHYKDKPLLLIGAVQLSRLSPERELWMLGTKHLSFLHLPAMREMFNGWRAERDFPLYARGNTREKCRYLEFFGFTPLAVEDGITLYEAPK